MIENRKGEGFGCWCSDAKSSIEDRKILWGEAPIIKTFGADLYGWFDIDSLPLMQNARRQRIAAAASAFQMGVPLNAINQVYQLGFPELPWGNDAYLPTNIQKVGHWTKPRNLVAADARHVSRGERRNATISDVDEAATKLLELLERTSK